MKILTTQSAGQGRLPNIQRGVLGLCLALLCTMSLEASAQKFQITTVDPPGSIESGSTMINAAAVITGWYYDASGDHGFVRSPDGTFTSFDVPGAVFVVPASINSVGEIVGTTSYTGGGFLREPDGIITMLYGPGSIDLSPAAINDEGTIAGFFWAQWERYWLCAVAQRHIDNFWSSGLAIHRSSQYQCRRNDDGLLL